MNKKQKDNLINALQELHAPDKDVLLKKIESKKSLGGEWEVRQEQERAAAKRKKRIAWTSFACSALVIVLAVILLSTSIWGFGASKDNNDDKIADQGALDYRYSWVFEAYGNISFDSMDDSMLSDVDLIYGYDPSWEIIKTQVTQDESAYREFYQKDGVVVKVTVFLEKKYTAMEREYYDIFRNVDGSFAFGRYKVYESSYFIGNEQRKAYVIYLKDQVYVITSDTDIQFIFQDKDLSGAKNMQA